MYHEHAVPLFAAHRCAWPNITAARDDSQRTKVLFVADPQLIDSHTYPGRPELLLQLSKHTVDTYLRQNYKALVNRLQPDFIIFLGDYLDNGRLLTDEYYEREVSRFRSIFDRWPAYQMGERWLVNLPGNHDIGFGDGVKIRLRKRFAFHFGTPNQLVPINGVDFVFLDTLSYSADDPDINSAARTFVQNIPPSDLPRILLSHVPLYRNTELVSCGVQRENPKFYLHKGYQYQLALLPEILQDLLDRISPYLIFSGDDHDYCDVIHNAQYREITVKSISMAMGIHDPAVQLLTYSVHNGSLNYNTQMCYLPTPYKNVISYVIMSLFLTAVLLLWNYKSRSSRFNYTGVSAWDASLEEGDMESSLLYQKALNYLSYQDAPVTSFAPGPNNGSGSLWLVITRAIKRSISASLIFAKKKGIPGFVKNCLILGVSAIILYNLSLLGT